MTQYRGEGGGISDFERVNQNAGFKHQKRNVSVEKSKLALFLERSEERDASKLTFIYIVLIHDAMNSEMNGEMSGICIKAP